MAHTLATIEHYLSLKLPDDAQISPDGALVAYVVAEVGKEAKDQPVRSQIWLTGATAAGPGARPLTAGPGADRSPRWAPAGDRIAFLSDRGGKTMQLYLLPMGGGEATQLTSGKSGVGEFAWTRDGKHIAFLMADPEVESESDVIHFEDRPRFQRIHLVDVATGEVRPVSPEGLQIWEFNESPDASSFAVIASAQPWEWSWYQSVLGVVDVGTGAYRELCRSGRQVALPRWAPDGSQVAFLSSRWSDRGSHAGGLWLVAAAGGQASHVTEGYEGSLTWFEWLEQDLLLFNGYEGIQATIGYMTPNGSRELLWKETAAFGPRFHPRFTRARSRIAVVLEDLNTAPDIWTADLTTPGLGWQRRSESNPVIATLDRGAAQVIRWDAPDGTEIKGILLTPSGLTAGERAPLVTIVHGGPTALFGARVNWFWAPFLAAAGIGVFMPNPRGSTGRGLAFAEANLGDMGGGDFRDIMAGIDAVIGMRIADPDRLGIAGWSYGGFMAAWAVTQTDRFKAAVVGAGITNWLSFHGTSNIPTWDEAYMQASPFEGDAYRYWSPITHVARVKTPTLLLHGEQDECVPVGQAYEFCRALREHGVKAHLRVYPREPHGLKEKAHIKDNQAATVDWFVGHLLE